MDVNKNTYTIVFAAIIVIIIAAILSVTSLKLEPLQNINIALEKKQNILKSIGIEVSRDKAEEDYYIYIKEEFVLNHLGEKKEELSALDVNLAKEVKKKINNQSLPVYIGEKNGAKKYIIPLRGKGLWGPIWGFIALNDDLNTVFGSSFNHKKETPGLGAEINRDFFSNQFKNKLIYENELVKFEVKKNGKGGPYEVDGISGGTITSNGVTDMIQERLVRYLPYFDRIKSSNEVDSVLLQMDSILIENKIILN
jgi:Na+-transporting NADH:ubiquinone oxidoreductase subunit C|tara:strand:+ start:1191 stop:1949 length:759 start_codon:yes stop_codon:yes gene_type:complete